LVSITLGAKPTEAGLVAIRLGYLYIQKKMHFKLRLRLKIRLRQESRFFEISRTIPASPVQDPVFLAHPIF